MKRALCKIVSVVLLALAAVAVVGAITVTGSGFLDLSNLARYFLIGAAVVFAAAAIPAGIYGWESKEKNE